MSANELQRQVEVREDSEQAVKLQEITDLLLAAGYFRARIKVLSPFDKVVGGMTWCIVTCNVDVDVDLLFHENLTIGQKIALTEKIVAVLPKMKCPHRLEPHQIQGLDFIHIYPVVQWLVKRAIETREETGDYIRAYSISQFYKNYKTPEDEAFENKQTTATTSVNLLLDTYRPKRLYRRQNKHLLTEEEVQVQSTLLEYGKRHGLMRMPTKDMESGSGTALRSQMSVSSEQDSESEMIKQEQQISAAMSSMSAMDTSEKLAPSIVGSIVGLQSNEIRQMASEYADRKAEMLNSENSEQGSASQRHKRVAASLQKQIEQHDGAIAVAEKRLADLQASSVQISQQLKESKEIHFKMEDDMKTFEGMETDENQSILKKLRTLVAMNESLKNQEQEFRAHCKEEKSRLETEIDGIQSTHSEDDQEDQERTRLIEKHYLSDKEKLTKLRLLLAKKNREIASLQRKLDEVPTRAELTQYQQRFLELYSQVSAKHKETKQFYTLYNTLDDTKLYLLKESNLLNSILDNFSEAMLNVNSKKQFLKQFEVIVEGVNQNKVKLEKKKQEEKMRKDQLNDTYLDLIEKQRIYFKTVRDFKEECRKNEVLLARLKGHRQGE